MTLVPIDKVADYWSSNKLLAQHAITHYMLRNRFQELYIRYQVAPPEHQDLWDQVRIMSKSLSILLKNLD
jgi:hypothetical protein